MKGFDPHLVKWIIIGLILLFRVIAATARKNKAKDRALRPPQSAPAPSPISSPTMNQSAPKPSLGKAPKNNSSDADSPWSTTNGPFDS